MMYILQGNVTFLNVKLLFYSQMSLVFNKIKKIPILFKAFQMLNIWACLSPFIMLAHRHHSMYWQSCFSLAAYLTLQYCINVTSLIGFHLITDSHLSASHSVAFLSVSSAYFSSLSLRLLLSSSSPRGHCVAASRLIPPSAKEETCSAGSGRKEIKSWGLSVLTAKRRSSAENPHDFGKLSPGLTLGQTDSIYC